MDEKMIDGLRWETKKDVGKWEGALLKWAYKVGRQVAVVLLEEMDDELMKGREVGLGVEGFRGRWVTGVLGDVWIERGMYRDEEGKYRYLLDEALGAKEGIPGEPVARGPGDVLGELYAVWEVRGGIKPNSAWWAIASFQYWKDHSAVGRQGNRPVC